MKKPSSAAMSGKKRLAISGDEDPDSDSDYVYDVFYRRPMPDTFDVSTWNHLAAIGTLAGLPPSVNDPDESDSESEAEDEDDEDSNGASFGQNRAHLNDEFLCFTDENYYKNEYPDTEESESASGSEDSGERYY
jgi:hypothetical protein